MNRPAVSAPARKRKRQFAGITRFEKLTLRITSCIVIPPNSNTFPDWRRTCHNVERGNNNLNFGLARDHVVHLETGGNLCTGGPDVKSQ